MLLEALLLPNNLDFGLLVVVMSCEHLPKKPSKGAFGRSGKGCGPRPRRADVLGKGLELKAEQEKSAMHQRGMSFRIVQL